jgi:hypothetical protein
VRSFLRSRKTGVRRNAFALFLASLALVVTGELYVRGLAPLFGFLGMTAFAIRAFGLLAIFTPAWRAPTVGMIEAVLEF